MKVLKLNDICFSSQESTPIFTVAAFGSSQRNFQTPTNAKYIGIFVQYTINQAKQTI